MDPYGIDTISLIKQRIHVGLLESAWALQGTLMDNSLDQKKGYQNKKVMFHPSIPITFTAFLAKALFFIEDSSCYLVSLLLLLSVLFHVGFKQTIID